MKTKKKFRCFLQGSAPFVIAHAKWARSRGRKPSMSFQGERDPSKALLLAHEVFDAPIIDPSQPIDYLNSTTPSNYRCCMCGARGIKLWRGNAVFLDYLTLLCAPCAAKADEEDISNIDSDGCYSTPVFGKSDQIGSYLPAVPTVENDAYWGYTSVPEKGCRWWRKLPTLPECFMIQKPITLVLEHPIPDNIHDKYGVLDIDVMG